VKSVSKVFLIQGLYLKLAGFASHTSKMHLLRERLINTTDAESQTAAELFNSWIQLDTHKTFSLSNTKTHNHTISS